MSDILITVTGGKASGKTTVLALILEALADKGLLSATDTRYLTNAPNAFFNQSRILNTETTECIEIELCSASVTAHATGLRQ